ncbi:MAG: aminotransferase class IV [Bacteroidetes bacterium]|nr:aminotransferase class IV [Bacteroidota bacterium]
MSRYEPLIPFSNRSFRYGDAVFETIRLCNNKLLFLKDHVTRLKLAMTVLRFNIPAEFTSENIQQQIITLLKHNIHAPNARIRLTVFRNEGGFYTPSTNDISFLIESELLNQEFVLNGTGLTVDIFTDIKKPLNKLSNLKTANALLYVMAGLSNQSMKLDDCLLVNSEGKICESVSSNVFVVKDGAIYTPPLNDGCIAGIMRKQIISLASQYKILVFEKSISDYILSNADEVFLTNSIQGIQWVGRFKQKFYTSKFATFFIEKLNQLTL